MLTPRQEFEECKHSSVPLFVAPSLADRASEPMQLFDVGYRKPCRGLVVFREKHAGFQLEMPERPEGWGCRHAKLPDVTLGRVA